MLYCAPKPGVVSCAFELCTGARRTAASPTIWLASRHIASSGLAVSDKGLGFGFGIWVI